MTEKVKLGGATHSFQVDIACFYGVPAALVYNHIAWCAENNKTMNKDHYFIEDKWWMRKRLDQFETALPYFTVSQIRTALGKLTECDLVVTGEFNEHAHLRTKWYAANYLEWFQKHKVDELAEQLGISPDDARGLICEI